MCYHLKKETYLTLVSVIFAVIALLHLVRVIYQWEAVIGEWAMPMWVSWVAVVVAGWLAWSAKKAA